MSHTRNFAELGLPDIDSAPQEYQTPDFADDNIDTHSSRSASVASSYQDLDQDGDLDDNASRLERPSLHPSTARARFSRSRVDARQVDFSDRIYSRRGANKGRTRSYIVSSARRRKKNGGEEFANGKFSDEDEGLESDDLDEETLEQRIARLKREVEEVQAETSRDNGEGAENVTNGTDISRTYETMAHLSNMLKALDSSFQRKTNSKKRLSIPQASSQSHSTSHTDISQDAQQTLQQAAIFETRLSNLESALGIKDTSTFSSSNSRSTTKTVLASLSLLETQLSIISATTAPSLEAFSRQIGSLTQEADRLIEARNTSNNLSNASSARSSNIPTGFSASSAAASALTDKSKGLATQTSVATTEVSDTTAARVASLHASLPQIERLAPMLPPLLERLRSLRALHAQAAEAGELLTNMEQAQGKAQADLRSWREGIERASAAVEKAAASGEANRGAVEAWVKQLEKRIDKM